MPALNEMRATMLATSDARIKTNSLNCRNHSLERAARQYRCTNCGGKLGDGSLAFRGAFTCAECLDYFAALDSDLRAYREKGAAA